MTLEQQVNELEQLMILQVKQLDRMEKVEIRRLAILISNKPELAMNLQKESDAVFEQSMALQKKIDEQMKGVNLSDLSSEKQKRIHSLTLLVRKLAKRNYELNQQCQKVLAELLSGISQQLAGIKKGREAVQSYHSTSSTGKAILSGQV